MNITKAKFTIKLSDTLLLIMSLLALFHPSYIVKLLGLIFVIVVIYTTIGNIEIVE